MQKPEIDLVISALDKIRQTSDRMPRISRSVLDRLQLRSLQGESVSGVAVEPEHYSSSVEGSPVAASILEAPPAHVAVETSPARRRLPGPDKAGLLSPIRARVSVCEKCAHLACTRTQTVFGVGNPNADLMFVGEAPGADEDRQGEPFVGKAGQLLTKILKAMGYEREDVYIANILKCRPDTPGSSYGNRAPTPQEMQTCLPYLVEQIGIIVPKVLVALGAVAVEGLLGSRGTMRDLRGRWHSYNGTPLMITYHPAYLLRNQSPSEKRKVWEDMLQVLERLERPISEKQRNYFR